MGNETATIGDDPVLGRAAAALAQNRLPDAYRLLAPRLAARPDHVPTLELMADLAARMGRLLDAARMIGRVIELGKPSEPLWQRLAGLLHRLPPGVALEEVKRQRGGRPLLPGYISLEAAMLERNGRPDEALALLRRLAADFPKAAGPWLAIGHLFKTLGRLPEAIDAYRRSIALDPARGEPWWALSDLKTFRFEAGDIAAMEALIARPALPAHDRLHLSFALGWSYERLGEPARAFAYYAEGNRLRRAGIRHDPARLRHEIEAAERLFTPEFFAARESAGCDAADPIFVVGLPRSGSTLVEQVLASHPQVEGTMELNLLPALVARIARLPGGYPDGLARLSHDELAALGKDYLDQARALRHTDRPRFVDKLPANFRFVGLIRLILPNARIVDVRRDPIANGFSIFRQNFASGHAFAFDLAEIGAYQAGYRRMMAMWDRALPGHVVHLSYERLVEAFEAEVRRLLDRLGLPFDPACLAFHDTARTVRTPSAAQVRQPINRAGLDGWRAFAPWLGPLRDATEEPPTA